MGFRTHVSLVYLNLIGRRLAFYGLLLDENDSLCLGTHGARRNHD